MSIDWWTLGIQAVNVLILVWLLGHFFWKPVAAMIEQRRVASGQMLADARAQQDRAAAALADIERDRAGLRQERETLLVEARAAADRLRAERLASASEEAVAILADARASAEKERAAATDAWRERAGRLAVDIAQRLCAPLAGAAMQAVFIDRLIDAVHGLPEAQRRGAATQTLPLDVVSAAPLAAAEESGLRERLAAAFGAVPRLVFSSDPALIAGIELRGAHLLVSNSWRADLQRILTELADDGA